MNPYGVLLLEALLFALAFGALTWLRGEGLPARFAWEVVGITAVVVPIAWATGITIHPVLFLVLIYGITMRTRLLVDLGNALSNRGKHNQALKVFELALRLASDPISTCLVRINAGVTQIRQQRFDEAIAQFDGALAELPGGRGGPKYEAACRYNLGMAYLRAGQEREASQEWHQVIELMPNSIYAIGAENALKKQQR